MAVWPSNTEKHTYYKLSTIFSKRNIITITRLSNCKVCFAARVYRMEIQNGDPCLFAESM